MEQLIESPYEYMKYKIQNAVILTYPYPHILIENIFPQEFYNEIIKNIPTVQEFTPKPKYPGRMTLTLDEIGNLDDTKKEFWGKIETWLKSDDFANLLLNKFAIKKPGYSDYFLHKDLEDFEVKPHKDVLSKLVTYLFYLPKDTSLHQLGTNILIPKENVDVEKSTKHQEWEKFSIVKSSKYLPNSFFAFTPCENSFHGVKIKFPSEIKKRERDTIRGFVFDKSKKDYPSYLFNKK
jgi:hypothetical protein